MIRIIVQGSSILGTCYWNRSLNECFFFRSIKEKSIDFFKHAYSEIMYIHVFVHYFFDLSAQAAVVDFERIRTTFCAYHK